MTAPPVPSDTDRLTDIRIRLIAASEGPWEAGPPSTHGDDAAVTTADGSYLALCPDCGTRGGMDSSDAVLVSHAPTDIAYLLEQNALLEGQLATAQAEVVIRDGAIVGRDKAIDSLEAWRRNWKPLVDAHMKRCNGCDACDSEEPSDV